MRSNFLNPIPSTLSLIVRFLGGIGGSRSGVQRQIVGGPFILFVVCSVLFLFYADPATLNVGYVVDLFQSSSRVIVGIQRIVEEMGREFDVLRVIEGNRHCPCPCFGNCNGNIMKFFARIEGL